VAFARADIPGAHPNAGRSARSLLSLAVAMAFAASSAALVAQTAGVALPLRPVAVAYDAAGTAYIADTDRNQIYEATIGGALIVVAGSGAQGFSGDGGFAVAAALNAPQGIALGQAGEMYIADTGNQRIRVVQAGVITTFAGTGVRGFSGDGGLASAAAFDTPTALAIDGSGALLICDTGNHRVRRISGGSVATIAGNGTQGYAGDGGAAIAAELDGPQGIAVASDGRIFVADSRNQRIRAVALDGTIATFAGTGVRGYGGDGGPAAAAELDLPRGLVLNASGTLIFADSDNHRIRQVDAQGTIRTLAGTGVQGASAQGTLSVQAWLNTPRGVALSSFGQVTGVDSANRDVSVAAANNNSYSVAALVPARVSRVSLSGPASAVYGSWTGQVSVSGGASTPLGLLQVTDRATPIGSATLTNGSAAISLSQLGAGSHALAALYGGDGVNPSASSGAVALTITPAPVVATANVAGILYGQPVPALNGTLTGVLPQDAGNVSAVFSSTAGSLSPVGQYPIVATLAGAAAANYTVTLSSMSGELQITQAPSATTLPTQAGGASAGAPLALQAVVSSTTSGTPTGQVAFSENGSVVALGSLAGGLASASYTAPAAGTHVITAAYAGDTNFKPSSSLPETFVIGAAPDFAVAPTGPATQTVPWGSVAAYTLSLSSLAAPFGSPVTMSVSGLPAGATASFSPLTAVPGSAGAAVTLSITTPVHAELQLPRPRAPGRQTPQWSIALAVLLVGARFRRARRRIALLLTIFMAAGWTVGCGTRTVQPNVSTSTTYALTVTGTATSTTGAVIAHSTTLTLILD
jgi:hypothetical protein